MSWNNLNTSENRRSCKKSIITDYTVLGAVKMCILKIWQYQYHGSYSEVNQYLKIIGKFWHHGDIEVIRLSSSCRLGKLPELTIVVLWSYQGGCNWERSESLNYFSDLFFKLDFLLTRHRSYIVSSYFHLLFVIQLDQKIVNDHHYTFWMVCQPQYWWGSGKANLLHYLCLEKLKWFSCCRLRYNFTNNVDIIHISLWDLSSNLSNEIKNKLDIISFALLSIYVPGVIEVITQ